MRMNRITVETASGAEILPQVLPIRCVRGRVRAMLNPPHAANGRAYLRQLRAAEMAAWEQTGGDYLRLDCVA